jgi:hypothetical protein
LSTLWELTSGGSSGHVLRSMHRPTIRPPTPSLMDPDRDSRQAAKRVP